MIKIRMILKEMAEKESAIAKLGRNYLIFTALRIATSVLLPIWVRYWLFD